MQPGLTSMALDDDQIYDLCKGTVEGYEPPEYPNRLQFSMSAEDFAKADAEGGDPGDTMRFSAMAEVTSVMRGIDDSRIELEISMFAGEDGKFFDLTMPPCICLCGPELEKLGLDDDAERGDLLHLTGMLRMESVSDNEWSGRRVSLQITDLAFVENESDESTED
jgi:hypothetical protein